VKKNHILKPQAAFLFLALVLALIAFGCETQDPGCGTTVPTTPTTPTTPIAYKVCTENLSVSSTSEAKLYYPCNLSKPTAASTLTSGTAGTCRSVEWLAQDMTTAGYVVLSFTPVNNNGLVPQWTNGHLAALQKLKQLNNTHSVLKGKIRTDALQLAGHSKGGGGALDAAINNSTDIASIIAMAPYTKLFGTGTAEYPVRQLSRVNADVLIQSGGSSDRNSPPRITREQYDALPNSISKAYHRFPSYGHMTWATIGDANAHVRLSKEIIAWMRYYLDGDLSQASIIEDPSQKDVNLWVK